MRKGILLALAIPAILLLGGYLFLRFSLQTSVKKEEEKTGTIIPASDTLGGKKVSALDLRPVFIQRLQLLAKHSSNDLYDVSFGDMKVDVLASTVSLHNVNLKPNKSILDSLKRIKLLPANVFNISFQSLVIEGINLDDAITSKTMDYKLVKLVKPVIHITIYPKEKGQKEPEETFAQRFLKQMQKLEINNLAVEGGTIIVHNEVKHQSNQVSDVSVNMNNILLDSTTRHDKQRFLFAKEATINFHNYTTKTSNGDYNIKIESGTVKAPQQQVTLQNFSIASPFSKEQFQKRHKSSKDMYNLFLNSIVLNNVNWWTLFNGEEMVADEVAINGGKFTDDFDRSLPPASRIGNFPNQLLMKVPFKLNIAKMKLENIDIAYQEFNPVSQQSGTIYIDNAAMEIAHISNEKSKSRHPVTVNGSGLFMHRIPLKASFTFDMTKHQSGAFTTTVSSSEDFSGDLINSFAMPLGLLKIEKGMMQDIKATIRGNELQATGEVVVQYKDLKLSLLEKDKGKTALDKKDFTSFFANAFVLKKNNPDGNKEPRQEEAEFKRDPNGGFFMLIWKTILVGALKTIGAPTKIAYKKGKPAEKN